MAHGPFLKGLLVPTDGLPIIFRYNPNEVSESRSVEWAKKRGLGMSHPRSQYVGGNDRTIQFSMWLNSPTRWGGVNIPTLIEAYIEKLMDLTYPVYRGGILISDPPTMRLVLGATVRRVKLASVNVTHRMWTKAMRLKMATVDISLFEAVRHSRGRNNSFLNLIPG